MKQVFFTVCILIFLPAAAMAGFFNDDTPANCVSGGGASFEAVFSSPGRLSPAVVKELASAGKSIQVVARDFVSKPVSEAIVKAQRAGRDVKVLLDEKSNGSMESAAQFLLTMSVAPHTAKNAIRADYIIIDDRDVIVGTVAGLADDEEEQKTAGQVLIVHNAPDLVKQYRAQFQPLWSGSQPMKQEK